MRFMVGMIIGLAVGWGIDFLFRRRQDDKLPERLEDVEAENRFLRTKLAEVEDALSKMPSGVRGAERKIEQLQAEPNVGDALSKMPSGVRGTRSNQIPQRKDRLERIKGIGAVFARRFNDAGIFTFDQLAGLTPEQVEEIVQVEGWQKIEPEQWIAEAKALAQEGS